MCPALGKSHQRHLIDFRYSTNQQCRLLWLLYNPHNQLDQYFQFVKETLLEEVNHLFILYILYQSKLAHHSGLVNYSYVHDNSIHCKFVLISVRCRWWLVPCYSRACHIYIYTCMYYFKWLSWIHFLLSLSGIWWCYLPRNDPYKFTPKTKQF